MRRHTTHDSSVITASGNTSKDWTTQLSSCLRRSDFTFLGLQSWLISSHGVSPWQLMLEKKKTTSKITSQSVLNDCKIHRCLHKSIPVSFNTSSKFWKKKTTKLYRNFTKKIHFLFLSFYLFEPIITSEKC